MKLNTSKPTEIIVFTLVENELHSSPQLEDQNHTNDWKTTNTHEGGLVMAYNNSARINTLYSRTFYALYIGPNNNSAGYSIFKLSTKQILTTPKYKPVPTPEDLIKGISETDSLTTIIQIDNFDSDNYTTQKDHFNNAQDDNQAQCNDVDNSEHESYNE